MKLQILIPQYQEDDKLVKELLDSIAVQRNIDFNDISVIICNDGSDVILSDQLLSSYNFHIEYHKEPHRGVSGTRNALLRYATADYIMYCDADDAFFSLYGLNIIFNFIKNGFDLFSSVFIQEEPQFNYQFRQLTADCFQCQGKVYNRNFLLTQDIHWNEQLSISEDLYFNVLCAILGKTILYTHIPIFLWKWNPQSCTRKQRVFGQRAQLNSYIEIFKELTKRDYLMNNKTKNFFLDSIFIIYDMYNEKEIFSGLSQQDQYELLNDFIHFFTSYDQIWNTLSYQKKQFSFNEIVTNKTYSDFINWIDQLKGEFL